MKSLKWFNRNLKRTIDDKAIEIEDKNLVFFVFEVQKDLTTLNLKTVRIKLKLLVRTYS